MSRAGSGGSAGSSQLGCPLRSPRAVPAAPTHSWTGISLSGAGRDPAGGDKFPALPPGLRPVWKLPLPDLVADRHRATAWGSYFPCWGEPRVPSPAHLPSPLHPSNVQGTCLPCSHLWDFLHASDLNLISLELDSSPGTPAPRPQWSWK